MKKFTKGMLIAAGIFGAVGIGLTAGKLLQLQIQLQLQAISETLSRLSYVSWRKCSLERKSLRRQWMMRSVRLRVRFSRR